MGWARGKLGDIMISSIQVTLNFFHTRTLLPGWTWRPWSALSGPDRSCEREQPFLSISDAAFVSRFPILRMIYGGVSEM